MAVVVLLAAAVVAAQDTRFVARDPAYAPDGRLAVSVLGDLWVRSSNGGAWTHLTTGPAWDHSPAWLPDGGGLVFVSDRNGAWDLFRLDVPSTASPAPAAVTAITTTPDEWESEPTTAPDGAILFVRGRGPTARIWIRPARGGAERRLTREQSGAERWPAVALDGRRAAYVRVQEGPDALRIHWLDRDSSVTVLADREIEAPAWSPAGDRLVFTTRTGRVGVWITATDGRYANLVSTRRARAAWSPNGRRLILATLPAPDVGYNGDPDRVADRERAFSFHGDAGLWEIAAPQPLGLDESTVAWDPIGDRATVNLEAFDQVWERVARRFPPDDSARRAMWDQLRERYRPRAQAARSDDELQRVIHELLGERPSLRAPRNGWAGVSSAHPIATNAGLEILRNGGNVVDAAVAVSFTLGVVEPDASGPGGYGQMLIALTGQPEPTLIEFMSRAPEEATLSNAALLRNGRYPDDGPVLAMVPGTVAAMELAWQKYGSRKLPWAALLEPAIRAAEQGYLVSDGLATTLAREQEHFLKYEGSRALFFPKGEPLRAGDTLRNPALAWTLRQIANGGARAFYQGEIARRMVTDLRGQGSAIRLSDLARYYAAERSPVSGTYRGYSVFSSAPPASGGATLVAQLNLLEHYRPARPYTDDARTAHAMIESWKLIPSGRGRIADPGLWPVQIEAFTAKDSASARWRCFRPDRALSPPELRGDAPPCMGETSRAPAGGEARTEEPADDCAAEDACHQQGTTAFVVADGAGNAVSVTQTLGTWGGNFYVTPELGFLYNDKLTSYGLDPEQYGARLPFARHGSSLAPTIVFTGSGPARRPVLAVGAAGNAWITSAVYSIVTGILDHGLPVQQAIESPRFLITGRGGGGFGAAGGGGGGGGGGIEPGTFVIQIEDGFDPEVTRRLRELGHELQAISLPGELRMGYAAAITLQDGRVSAGADPRRSGAAGAVQCGEGAVAADCRGGVERR